MKARKIALWMLLMLAALCVCARADGQAPCAHDGGWQMRDDAHHSCKLCGETFSHAFSARKVEATCRSVGYTMDVCQACGYEGEQYDIQPVDSGAHVWGDWTVAHEATCTRTGSRSHSCLACGREETEVIPLAEHKMKEEVVAPDCVNGGYTLYTCAVCGAQSEKTDIVPPSAAYHHWGEFSVVAPATCTAAGEQVRSCEICGAKHRQEIEAVGHRGESVTVAPGCENGYTVEICTVCGEEIGKRTDIVPAAHVWSEWQTTAESGCRTEGEETRVCALCGAKEMRAAAALGHAYFEVTQAPTCYRDGYTAMVCARCGQMDAESRRVIPASEDYHVWDEERQTKEREATCTVQGINVQSCAVCGATRRVYTATRAHEGVETAFEATFARDGYTVLTCKVCGSEVGPRRDIVRAGMYAVEMQKTPVLGMEIRGAQSAVLYTAVSEEGEIAAILEVCADENGDVVLDFDDDWYAANHVCRVVIASNSVVVTAEAEGMLHAQIACAQETDELLVCVQANLPNDGFDEAIGAYRDGVYEVELSEESETTVVGRYISVEAPQGPGKLLISTAETEEAY